MPTNVALRWSRSWRRGLANHPTGTTYAVWDNATPHEDDEVAAVLRGATGQLVLLYLPTSSPWLARFATLWRHLRREVTHCAPFVRIEPLLNPIHSFFDRHNRSPGGVRSAIRAPATGVLGTYFALFSQRNRALVETEFGRCAR